MENQNKIAISVIVPSYNGMPLFKKSLDSVLNQNGVSFEVLVGNDSPSDLQTKTYLDQLENKNLRVFHNDVNLWAIWKLESFSPKSKW